MLSKKALSAASSVAPAIEDVFSTWLYTGNGSTQTITNGIDLAGEGGMVWVKERGASGDHSLFDTNRGAGYFLYANTTAAEAYSLPRLSSFNTSGFSLGVNNITNANASTYSSWTFRKAPKFFDVVTYTGNGTSQSIPHNLESAPGFIVVKARSATSNWVAYHRSIQYGISYRLVLNSNLRTIQESGSFSSVSSTTFSVGNAASVNQSGVTYVAYLFAHNAGGFGSDGNQNVVTCSNYTGNGSATGPTVNLGYEPQWLLVRRDDDVDGSNWYFFDNMRGVATGGIDNWFTQGSGSETSGVADYVDFTSTGFQIRNSSSEINANNDNYVYIAIRRGPMREPTSGTQVLGLNARAGTGANATVTGGITADAVLIKNRSSNASDLFSSRLTGDGYLSTQVTTAEASASPTFLQTNPWDVMDGVKVGTTGILTNSSGDTFINYLFKRAPGFFDVVTYTGTGATRTVSHNLGAVPELMIVKKRSGGTARAWAVYANNDNTDYLVLNSTAATVDDNTYWNDTSPTAAVFTVRTADSTNENTGNYIAYLFASLPGVSKVGSYTGNGSSQTINCEFTSGARFILIKRIDSTGDWYVWDTARGIVTGNDPRWILNGTAAEVTTDDTIDPASSGFIVNQVAATNVNVNAASYIYLAIA